MNIKCTLMMLGLVICVTMASKAQQLKYTNYYNKIKKYDLSKLWYPEKDKKEVEVLAISVP